MASVLPDGTLKNLRTSPFLLSVLHLLALLAQVHFHLKTQEHTRWKIRSRIAFQADSNYPLIYHWKKALLASMCHFSSSMFAVRAWLLQQGSPCHGSNQRT